VRGIGEWTPLLFFPFFDWEVGRIRSFSFFPPPLLRAARDRFHHVPFFPSRPQEIVMSQRIPLSFSFLLLFFLRS